MKCCRPDFDTFFILMFFHKAFATAFAGSWRSSSIEGKAVQGRPWDCGGPFAEWYCRRTPGNPDGSSFKWIYKKILRWIKWMDLRWTFWICYDLLSFSPSLRISTVTVQLSGCRSCSCWGVASTGCSKWQPSLRDVLMWFVSKMENQWKSWNGKKETRISKAMKWWMTWPLNFERNFDFLAFLSTPHGDLAQSTPFRAGMSRRFTLSGRAALCLSCESAPKARKKAIISHQFFPDTTQIIGTLAYIYI